MSVLLHALSGIIVVVCSDMTKLLHNTIVTGHKKIIIACVQFMWFSAVWKTYPSPLLLACFVLRLLFFFMNVHLNSPSDHPSSACTVCLFASLLCRWRSRAGNKELWLVELFIFCHHNLRTWFFIFFLWYRKWLTLVMVDKTCSDNPEEFESGVRLTGCL